MADNSPEDNKFKAARRELQIQIGHMLAEYEDSSQQSWDCAGDILDAVIASDFMKLLRLKA